MKNLLIPILAIACAGNAHGRIGDTLAQCEARYGRPLLEDPAAGNWVYLKSGFMISIHFTGGVATEVFFAKGEPGSEAYEPMTEAERATLLATMAGTGAWEPAPSDLGALRWANPAESTAAVFHKEKHTLTVLTGQKAQDALTFGKENAPAPAPSDVRLVAQTSGSVRTTERYWNEDSEKHETVVYRSRSVATTVTAKTKGKAIIECHWIGSDPDRPSAQFITKVDRIPIELEQNETFSQDFTALFVDDVSQYSEEESKGKVASRYFGWVVRVVAEDGTVLAATAARSPMLKLVASD